MKNRINKKIPIIIVIIILSSVVGLVSYLVLKDDNTNNNFNGNNYEQNEEIKKITGKERINVQSEIVKIIKKYVDNNPNILEHAKNNKLVSISIKEIADDFKINISEFENLPYNCNSSKTNIKFKNEYSNYYITLNCESFYLDSNDPANTY